MTATVANRPVASQPVDGNIQRYLGSARVVAVDDRSLRVVLEEEATPAVVHATLALAFPYRPTIGDQLLVVGDSHAFFAIGVLAGRGRTTLVGTAAILAEQGRLRLVGDRGVRLASKRLHIEAERFRSLAVTARQTFGEMRTQVREQLKIEAGEVDELSQKTWLMQARQVVIKSLTGARVKSMKVRLG